MLKNCLYCSIVLTLVLGCGEPPIPMPTDESYKIPANTAPSPLSKEWEKMLDLIDDKVNKDNFSNNIRNLKPENHDKILEILNIISTEDHRKRFLQDLSSFKNEDQLHLISIFLYIEDRNKPLILKLVRCPDCLSIFDKLKMLKIIHNLDDASQRLIKEFEEKLDEKDE